MSSSGMSDSETHSNVVFADKGSFAQGNFSTKLLPPILDIAPPPVKGTGDGEVVMYSKEVQTASWVAEEESDEESDEVIKRRVEEEVRREMDRLKIEEDRMRVEEQHRHEAEKDVPGACDSESRLTIVISEEEQQRILASDHFHDFLSRSSKIVERALDEDYDVLADYTRDVEANQYPKLSYIKLI